MKTEAWIVLMTSKIENETILLWLSKFLLIAMYATQSHASTPSIVYEECPIYEQYYDLTGGRDELKQPSTRHEYGVRLALCAKLDGLVYRIESPLWLDEYRYLTVELVNDFDGDGWSEAIVELSTGGNGCCFKSYLISYVGAGFFKVDTDKFFIDSLEFKSRTYKDQKLLMAIQRGKSINNLLYESLGQYLVEHGELKLLNISKNTAVIDTDFSFTQEMSGKKNPSYQLFVDDDHEPDEITCNVWGRSYLLSCELSLSTRSERVSIPTWCWKISFISSKTNGLKDIICNLTQVFKLDSTGKYLPFSAEN